MNINEQSVSWNLKVFTPFLRVHRFGHLLMLCHWLAGCHWGFYQQSMHPHVQMAMLCCAFPVNSIPDLEYVSTAACAFWSLCQDWLCGCPIRITQPWKYDSGLQIIRVCLIISQPAPPFFSDVGACWTSWAPWLWTLQECSPQEMILEQALQECNPKETEKPAWSMSSFDSRPQVKQVFIWNSTVSN